MCKWPGSGGQYASRCFRAAFIYFFFIYKMDKLAKELIGNGTYFFSFNCSFVCCFHFTIFANNTGILHALFPEN